MYGVRSVLRVMAAPEVLPFSNANWLAAASIWRRLLMQAFCCEVARAFTKLGIAMAANRPMMATTIMISTKVKPARSLLCLFFIRIVSVLCALFAAVVNRATGVLFMNYV